MGKNTALTLDKVTIQIEANSEAANTNINGLATSLEHLKKSLSGGFNNLNKLATALDALKKSSKGVSGAVEQLSQLDKVSSSLVKLSSIANPVGLTKAVENLGKLPGVFNRIDTNVIENVASVSNSLAKSLDPLATNLGKISTGFTSLSSLAKNYGVSITNVMKNTKGATTKSINLSKQLNKINRSMIGIMSSISKVGDTNLKPLKKLESQIKQIGLSLLGTRTIFTLTRKAVSEYMAMDSELTKSIQNSWRALGAQLAPAIEYVIYLFTQAIRVVYSVIYALSGLDLIARANAKAMAAWGKSAKDTLGALQKFDDLNVAEFDNGSGDNSLINLDKIDLTPIQWIIDALHRIKKAFREAFDTGKWYGVGVEVANLINESAARFNDLDILSKLEKVSTKVSEVINGLFVQADGGEIGKSIQTTLLILPRTINTLLRTVKWDIIGTKISDALKSINFTEIIEEWSNRFILLANGFQTALLAMDSEAIANSFSQVILGILNSFNSLISTIKWSELGVKLHNVIVKMDWKSIFKTIGDILLNVLAGLGDAIAGVMFGAKFKTKASSVFTGIGVILGGILLKIFSSTLFTKLGTLVNKLFKSTGLKGMLGGSKGITLKAFEIPKASTILKGLGELALIVAGVGAFVLAIGELTRITGFEKYTTTGLRLIVDVFEGIGSIILPLSIIAAEVVALGFATPLTVLAGLGGMAEIMAGIPAVLLVIGELTRITGFEKYTKSGLRILVDVFNGLKDIIVPVGEISALVVTLGFASPLIVTSGLLGIAEIIYASIKTLEALSELYRHEGFKTIVQDGGEALRLLGSALGTGMGAITDGMINASTTNLPEYGTRISEFASELKPFLEIVKTIDRNTAENTAILANGILNITAANVLDSIFDIATFGTKQTLKQFGENLKAFGVSFKAYADTVKGIDSKTLESSTNAAKAIAEFSSTLKPHDGVWQKIVGDNKLSDFGAELANFGANFVIYARNISAVTDDNYKSIDRHLQSIGKIIEVYNSIPKSFTSVTNTVRGQSKTTTSSMLQTFGTELTKFGTNMATYYNKIKTIDSDKMDSVTFALQNIIVSLEAINKYGLTNTLTEFSNSLKSSASNIVSFFSTALSTNTGYNTGYNFGKSIGQGISNALKNTNFPSLRLFGLNGNTQIGSYKIQSYETGTNEVPYEGLYHLHEGEAVVPKKYNPALGNGTDRELGEKLDTLIDIMNNMNYTNIVNIGNKTVYKHQEKYNRKQNDKYGTTVNI